VEHEIIHSTPGGAVAEPVPAETPVSGTAPVPSPDPAGVLGDAALVAGPPARGGSLAPVYGIGLALLAIAVVALGFAFVREERSLGAQIVSLRAQLARTGEAATPTEPPAPAEGAPADRPDPVSALAQRVAELETHAATVPAVAAAEVQGLRDEGAALEVERLVGFANQELQINGSVPTAITALQSADARLARQSRPQYVELRRAMAHDLERLRATPVVDVDGMAIRLDQLQQGIESWPMLSDPQQRPAADEVPVRAGVARSMPATVGLALRAWLAAEFGDLVRIREVALPDALLVDSQQQVQIRDRLRLRLLGARLALLARDDRLFHADINEAASLIARYFDVKRTAVGAALSQVRTLAATPIVVEVPTINDTVAALRVLRTGTVR
jgi:uncharacterized protein HemX